jgi:hypothetical protein
MPFNRIFPILAMMLSASCTSGSSLPPDDCPQDFCKWAYPIYVADQEVISDTNARKINAMRDAGVRFCGWKKPE